MNFSIVDDLHRRSYWCSPNVSILKTEYCLSDKELFTLHRILQATYWGRHEYFPISIIPKPKIGEFCYYCNKLNKKGLITHILYKGYKVSDELLIFSYHWEFTKKLIKKVIKWT